MRIVGEFDVKMTPQADGLIGRMSLDKQYRGDLEAAAKGEMIAARTAVPNSAGYVAIKLVTGKLSGRQGSFVLQHSSTITRGVPQQSIMVVPDSGAGELEELSGKMMIDIRDRKHFYEFEYELA